MANVQVQNEIRNQVANFFAAGKEAIIKELESYLAENKRKTIGLKIRQYEVYFSIFAEMCGKNRDYIKILDNVISESYYVNALNGQFDIILNNLLKNELYDSVTKIIKNPMFNIENKPMYSNDLILFLFRLVNKLPRKITDVNLEYIEQYILFLINVRCNKVNFYVRFLSILHPIGIRMKEVLWSDIPFSEYQIYFDLYFDILIRLIEYLSNIDENKITDEQITYLSFVATKLKDYRFFPYVVEYTLNVDNFVERFKGKPEKEIVGKVAFYYQCLKIIFGYTPSFLRICSYFGTLGCDTPIWESIFYSKYGKCFRIT